MFNIYWLKLPKAGFKVLPGLWPSSWSNEGATAEGTRGKLIRLSTIKLLVNPLAPSIGKLCSLRHSGHRIFSSSGSIWHKHAKQNVWKHGNIFGSTYCSKQIEHSSWLAMDAAMLIYYCCLTEVPPVSDHALAA